MLLRAMFVSLLLHLAIFGVTETVTPVVIATKRSAPEVLSASLMPPSSPKHSSLADVLVPADHGTVLANKARITGERNFDFGRISRSTVAMDRSNKSVDGASAEFQTADVVADFPVDAVNVDGERLYRLSLARVAKRFRDYPDMARAEGWEGVAVVSIAVVGMGGLPVVSLASSSGHQPIDEQALFMMAQAVKATALPPEMQGRRFRLLIPLEYRLAE